MVSLRFLGRSWRLVPAVLRAGLTLPFGEWRARRRRRKAPAETPWNEDPSSDLPRSALQVRVYTKRQRLWLSLMKDSDLMLKNRIEVRHLMTRDLLIVSPGTTAEEMTTLMDENRVRHLLVCGDDGRLLGIVSNRDLSERRGDSARAIMTPSPRTVSSDTPISAAITCLVDENISCLPVVNHGRLCGVITSTDLVLTLQCTLQLWLRVAQTVQSNPDWIDELEAAGKVIDDDLTVQQTHLEALGNRLKEIEVSEDGEVLKNFSREAVEMLEASKKLVEQIGDARNIIRDQTQWLASLIDLRTDSLTGLAGRRELPAILDMMLALRRRHKQPFSVVIVGIDDFEAILEENTDSLVAQMLRTVAELIGDGIRGSDFLTRYEDDTFVVVLPQTDLEGASVFSERLRKKALKQCGFTPPLRLRAGVVCALGDETSSALLARADAALAEASLVGGNAVVCHNGADFELVDRDLRAQPAPACPA